MLDSSSTNSTRGFTSRNLAVREGAFPRLNPRLPRPWRTVVDLGGMPFSRSQIAAVATIAALGALAVVALSAGGAEQPAAPPAPTAETDPQPEIRTEVIRRTIHRRPRAAAASGSGGS